ncbi:MAG: hypothetical protein HKP57_03380 [Halobacteria archaeon]|nr:hypothetical protein [Halobacteria archaeon]
MISPHVDKFAFRLKQSRHALAALFFIPTIASAGAYIFAENNGANIILHPGGYFGMGGTLTVRVCIKPNTANATAMEIPVQNNINIYNDLQPTTGNLVSGGANNIPSGTLDFESVLLHEIGHCLGMAHVNLASESYLTGDNRNYTKSTDGNNNTYDLHPGADGYIGSSDDIRGDDINLHWFRKSNNNPFTIDSPVDASTYSRNLADLPSGHTYAANGDRTVAGLLGVPNTEAVMQQGTGYDEAQRMLAHDDVATLLLAASGIDETASTSDDYTINLEYGGISNSGGCDVQIAFDNSKTSLAVCEVSGSSIAGGDHWRIASANIYFNNTASWFFNTATVNQPPVLTPIGDQTVVEGASLSVPVTATDADGDNLSLTATGLPLFATLTDPGNGNATLDVNPGTGDAGTYTVKIDVDDDGLPVLGDSETFDIIVTTPVIDTDGDGIDDATEILIGTDPGKVDSDGDGLVDGADGVVSTATHAGIDTNGDGFVDGEDLNANGVVDSGETNPTNPDTDGDGFIDGDEVFYASDPLTPSDTPANGDINEDGMVNAADVLLATRIVMGQYTPSADETVRADVAPFNGSYPLPDGNINAGDLVRIQRMAVGMP